MERRGRAGGREQAVLGKQTRRRSPPEKARRVPLREDNGNRQERPHGRRAKFTSTTRPFSDRRARGCLLEEGGLFRTCNAQYTKHMTGIKKGFSLLFQRVLF